MRPLGGSILLTGLLLVAIVSWAFAGPRLASPGPTTGGGLVRTTVPALPADAREFELVIVLDDGSTRAVSPERPAGVTSIEWRAPNVAARHARLELRAGGAGWERVIASSDAFAIEPDAALALEARGALEWADGPADASFAGRSRTSFDPLTGGEAALVESDDLSVFVPVAASTRFELPRVPRESPRRAGDGPPASALLTTVNLRL